MDIRHYRATWPLPNHKQPQLEEIVEAVVSNVWGGIFQQPAPNLPPLPEEVFAEWLSRQDLPNATPSVVRPLWRLFLRRSATSWERYRTTCLKNRQYPRVVVAAVDENLRQLWPGECNNLKTPKLRIDNRLLSRTSCR